MQGREWIIPRNRCKSFYHLLPSAPLPRHRARCGPPGRSNSYLPTPPPQSWGYLPEAPLGFQWILNLKITSETTKINNVDQAGRVAQNVLPGTWRMRLRITSLRSAQVT